ncbi:DUF7674 family protein [Peijinzhouia sedimentorum]
MSDFLQQLEKQFPEIYPPALENGKYVIYEVLNHFGAYCALHIEEEKTREILNAIDQVYQQKQLFTCNAIENEFLSVIALKLGAKDLINHLKKIPKSLWAGYIKVLIETNKINSP